MENTPVTETTDAPSSAEVTVLSLTQSAASQVEQLLAQESFGPGKGMLRVKVIGGGCSGYSYDMYLDDEVKEGDLISESYGIKMVTDAMSISFLEGTEIDYEETLTHSGFKFQNPKADDTCGCGISFSA